MKIMFHGYFGFGNTGDEAILDALLCEYKQKYNAVEFVILSSNPKRSAKLHGIKAIKESILSPIFWRELLTTNLLVFAGGGRYGDSTWRRMTFLGLIAKLLRKKIIFRSIGVYPYNWQGSPVMDKRPEFSTGLTRLLVKVLIDIATYVSVRDPYSYKALKLIGLSKDIVIEIDPVLNFNEPRIEEHKHIAEKWLNVKRPILGINLRTLDTKTNADILSLVIEIINWFENRFDGSVIFIPFGFGSFLNRYFDNDLIIGKILAKKASDVILINEELHPREIAYLVQEVDILIVMRHHAIIYAARYNKPMVAFIYDIKSIELIKLLRNKFSNILPIVITKFNISEDLEKIKVYFENAL